MNRYIRYYSEDEDDKNNNGIPDWLEPGVTEILEFLRDNSFGNEEGRKMFLNKMTSLHTSGDRRARRAFKYVGDMFTKLGDELINYGQDKEEE